MVITYSLIYFSVPSISAHLILSITHFLILFCTKAFTFQVGLVYDNRCRSQFRRSRTEKRQGILVRNQKAPLLLGQSVLSRLGKIEIDYKQQCLIITRETEK